MPRNRNVRVAVLGSSVQRAARTGHSSTRSSPLKRRFVVVGLVLLSLVLLTISFRSSALDPVEGFSAAALRPFEIATGKVARPFRDATSWTHGLLDAKAENRLLRKKNAKLYQQNVQLHALKDQNFQLAEVAHYVHSPTFPQDYTYVTAQVLTPPSTLDQTMTIAAGTGSGIVNEDVVVTDDGDLVGTISKAFGSSSQVNLITSPTSAAWAVDEQHQSAVGLLDHSGSDSTTLLLDEIGTDKIVHPGDEIVTAGSSPDSKYPSPFPRDVPVGTVADVTQNDTDIYKEIEVQPYVDLSSLQTVLVLIPKHSSAGAGR